MFSYGSNTSCHLRTYLCVCISLPSVLIIIILRVCSNILSLPPLWRSVGKTPVLWLVRPARQQKVINTRKETSEDGNGVVAGPGKLNRRARTKAPRKPKLRPAPTYRTSQPSRLTTSCFQSCRGVKGDSSKFNWLFDHLVIYTL